jgi:DNA primase
MNEKFVGFNALKASVSMLQVLDHYGLTESLRRSGDNLSGACPLHQGHNRTQFRVSMSKNCWMCFGDCHTGGSIIDFVSRMEGIGVREAGLLLQDWFSLRPGNGAFRDKLVPFPGANGKSVPPKKPVNPPLRLLLGPLDSSHPYLRERGLTAETVQTFGIGCCQNGSFRGWIAIPIHNAAGQLVAYARRWPGVPPDDRPKYLLPRGFRKSLELFNQHRAAEEEKAGPLVVVEGFFGCMWVWQAGHRRVVSLMGSMLSTAQEQRILALAGYDRRVLLLLDGDAAGGQGCAQARQRLSRQVAVSAAHLQDGQQPDSLSAQELLRLIGDEKEAA